MRKLLIIICLLAGIAAAQGPTLTTVSDAIYGGSGTITITAAGTFTTADGYVIPKGWQVTASLGAGGAFTVQLPPNSGSTPASYYTAYYSVVPDRRFAETWVVPSSATPVRLSAVRSLAPPAPSFLFSWSQIEQPPDAVSGCLVEWLSGTSYTCGTAGAGSVTSVAITAPPWLTVSGSPVTGSGTLALAAATGLTVHEVLGSGSGGTLAMEALAPADLPGAGAVTVNTASPLSGGGAVSLGGTLDLACSSCMTAIPAPTSTTLGGAESIAATAHEWLNALGTDGVFTESQPGFPDLSGLLADGQLPADAARFTGTITATHCADWSSPGVLADAGAPCGSGGSGMVYPAAGVPYSTGSAWGTSYAVGSAANELLQVGSGGTIPAAVVPTLNQSTTGNAATATALAATPNQCPSTQIVTGIAANGDANCQDPLVSGPTANGSAPAAGSNPVLMGLWDGTYVRTLKGDTSGDLDVNVLGTVPVSISGTPAVQIQSDASINLTELGGTLLGAPTAWGTAPSGDVPGVNADVLSLPPLPPGSNTIGNVGINGTVAVSGTFWQATQPVSGTVTANAGTGWPVLPTTTAPLNDSTSGLTQEVAAVSGKAIYFYYTAIAASAVTVEWEYGTGTNCGTGTAALTGPMPVGASGGAAPPHELIVPAGNALCVNLGSAIEVAGDITYAQQ